MEFKIEMCSVYHYISCFVSHVSYIAPSPGTSHAQNSGNDTCIFTLSTGILETQDEDLIAHTLTHEPAGLKTQSRNVLIICEAIT